MEAVQTWVQTHLIWVLVVGGSAGTIAIFWWSSRRYRVVARKLTAWTAANAIPAERNEYDGSLECYAGTYRGRPIHIDPDHAQVTVALRHQVAVTLGTQALHESLAGPNQQPIPAAGSELARLYPLHRAAPELLERFGRPELAGPLCDIARRWQRALDHILAGPSAPMGERIGRRWAVMGEFKRPTHNRPQLMKVDELDALLTDLFRLAELLEGLGGPEAREAPAAESMRFS